MTSSCCSQPSTTMSQIISLHTTSHLQEPLFLNWPPAHCRPHKPSTRETRTHTKCICRAVCVSTNNSRSSKVLLLASGATHAAKVCILDSLDITSDRQNSSQWNVNAQPTPHEKAMQPLSSLQRSQPAPAMLRVLTANLAATLHEISNNPAAHCKRHVNIHKRPMHTFVQPLLVSLYA
jgi:hypothetical protein